MQGHAQGLCPQTEQIAAAFDVSMPDALVPQAQGLALHVGHNINYLLELIFFSVETIGHPHPQSPVDYSPLWIR
jgi:hypothetical protein